MSLTKCYFEHHAAIRAAEEELEFQRSGRVNTHWQRRQLINEQWQKAAEDQEREKAYQAHIANAKGEQEYPMMDGL